MDFSINKRLIEVKEQKQFSWEELRKKLGINKAQQVSGWVQLKDKIPIRYVIMILELYDDIDARWFLTGEITDGKTKMHGNGKSNENHTEEIKVLCRTNKFLLEYIEELKETIEHKEKLIFNYESMVEKSSQE